MDTNELPKAIEDALDALALDAAACMAFLAITVADGMGANRRELLARWRESLPVKRDPELDGRVTSALGRLLETVDKEMARER